MSFRTKLFSAITASAAVAALSTFAAAQDNPSATEKTETQKAEKMERKDFGRHGARERGMHGDKRGEMFGLRGIELTDAQKEQVRKIREANRPDEATWKEMKTLMEAKRSGTLTADQQERLKTLRSEHRRKSEALRSQIEAILTPEQRQQLETRKQEMRQKMQEHRQMHQQKGTAPDATKDN